MRSDKGIACTIRAYNKAHVDYWHMKACGIPWLCTEKEKTDGGGAHSPAASSADRPMG
jgi:hypothetical protein